jgi:hypothetical protein
MREKMKFKLRYITVIRDELQITRAFLVRVPNIKTKTFTISKFSNFKTTLNAALEYRNLLLKEHYFTDPNYTGKLYTKNNKSGVVGITKRDNKWVASVNNSNYYFSIDIYGEKQALKNAMKIRFQHMSIGGFTRIPHLTDLVTTL